MPGLGTFNLTAFWRAMGIKNPRPTMLETVQPVLVVGDMSGLTPQHVPPTGLFGRDQLNIAGEFPFITVNCRDPGGILITGFWQGQTPQFARIDAAAVPAPTSACGDRGPLSVDAVLTTCDVGSDPVNPVPFGSPTWPPLNNVAIGPPQIYLPAGAFMCWSQDTVNTSLTSWGLIVQAVPASEPSAD